MISSFWFTDRVIAGLLSTKIIFPEYYGRIIEQGYGAYDGRVTSGLVTSSKQAGPGDFNYEFQITEEGLQ